MSYTDAPFLSAGYPFATPLSSRRRKPFRLFRAVFRALIDWQARLIEREALRQMPDYLLRDRGLDIVQARREADKPFWRA